MATCTLVMGMVQAGPLRVAVSTGAAYNFSGPLNIYADGQDILMANSAFSTNYHSSLYNVVLGSDWIDPHIDFELHHHKVVLKDPALVSGNLVQQYQATNGFNFLTVNYNWQVPWLMRWVGSREYVRVGFGPVFSYPISRLGTEPDAPHFERKGSFCLLGKCGFFWNGGVAQIAWVHVWSFPLLSYATKVHLRTELKGTLASATVPVTNGYSVLNNKAVHLYVGVQFGD